MASSNVEYYQRQKELQDFMCEQEKRRQHLEQQLQVYSRSDERLAKLRAVRLQSHWRKICEDQRRSQQRNEQIIREFERIDTHLSSMSSRTERLRLLKQQYEDYIERTYPQWHQQVLQMRKRKDESQQEHHERATNLSQFSQYAPQKQQPDSNQMAAPTSTSQFISQPNQYETSTPGPSLVYASPTQAQQNQYVTSTPAQHQQQQQVPSVAVTPIHGEPKHGPKTQVTQESAVYANFTSVTRDSNTPQFSVPQQQSSHQQQYTAPPQTTSDGGYKMPAEKESDAQLRVNDLQGDISFGSDDPINLPIQSITVEKSGQKVTQEQRVDSPDIASGQMEPSSADDGDDDISNFDDDDDIPLSGRQAPTPARQATSKDIADDLSSSPEDSPVPTRKPGVLTVPTAGESHSPFSDTELSIEGVVYLMQYIESVIPGALSLEGFYRSTPPQQGEKLEIISKANSGDSLSDMDVEMASMIVLEQVTIVIHTLPSGCLLPDAILASSHTINEVQIGRVLSIEARPLWDCLINHFIQLVKHKVMTVKEVAIVFVPCLVSEMSDYQDKAYELLVNLIEKKVEQATPREAAESMRSSLGGVEVDEFGKFQVPPLKFGSLVDSKQHSDDEDTTMVTPSVPTEGPRVPLNETAAYRNLLSGTITGQKQPNHHDDDEDDTDDDVEKQFASTLSPRTPRDTISTIPPQPTNTTAIIPQSRPPQQMEPLSETSSAATSPVYVPTGMKKSVSGKSDAGSTGKSSMMQPFKRPPAAVMISSDLDSETDLDILLERKQTSQEEDDFYDFYE